MTTEFVTRSRTSLVAQIDQVEQGIADTEQRRDREAARDLRRYPTRPDYFDLKKSGAGLYARILGEKRSCLTQTQYELVQLDANPTVTFDVEAIESRKGDLRVIYVTLGWDRGVLPRLRENPESDVYRHRVAIANLTTGVITQNYGLTEEEVWEIVND